MDKLDRVDKMYHKLKMLGESDSIKFVSDRDDINECALMYNKQENLKSLIIPSNVKTIHRVLNKFKDYFLPNLKLIGGNGLVTVGYTHWFKDFSEIDTVDLSELNLSNISNLSELFFRLHARNLILGDFDISGAETLTGLFKSSKIQNDVFKLHIKGSKIQDMDELFYGASFKTLELSITDIPNVDSFYSMFLCTHIEKLIINDIDTREIECLENMFNSFSTPGTLDISKLSIKNNANITAMFRKCRAEELITSIDTSKFSSQNLKEFATYNSIKTVKSPSDSTVNLFDRQHIRNAFR